MELRGKEHPRKNGTLQLVPGGGVEPPRPEGRRILSPLRLPVPPSRLSGAQKKLQQVSTFFALNSFRRHRGE
jgi:hypothetical protein